MDWPSAATDLAAKLEAESPIGTVTLAVGTNVFVGPELAVNTHTPPSAVFVRDIAGAKPEPYLGNTDDFVRFQVEVVVRTEGNSYSAGDSLARAILNKIQRNPPSGYVSCLVQQSGPEWLGQDEEYQDSFRFVAELWWKGGVTGSSPQATEFETRLDDAETAIEALEIDVAALLADDLDGRLTTAEGEIDTLQGQAHDALTLGNVGSTPSAAGASLSAQVLTLQPADGSNPGVVTASAQTIGGAKTFNNPLTVPNGLVNDLAVKFAGNSTDGLYYDAANRRIHVVINGTSRFYVDTTTINLNFTSSLAIQGGVLGWSPSAGITASSSSARARLRQTQTAVRVAELIGIASDPSHVAATRSGTSVTDAASGNTAVLHEFATDCLASTPSAKARVWGNGDVESITGGFVLRSPNGHRWRASIDNAGAVTWTDLDA
jgi:hypothetical protein